jgi:ABC-2 type transport system ATP-binding protein
MTPMIAVSKLCKRFGPIVAVDNLSFEVDRGEVLGFLGPNGAGKSTTMKMITGFLAADAGQIRVCGLSVDAEPLEIRRRMGYLPEGAPLYADMTPASFLDFVAGVRGFAGKARRQRIDQVVERVNLQTVLQQPMETLSKGFKRRVGLAQAILHDPEILILDEPTDGLDPNQKHEVRELIREMASDKCIVLSTHILEEVDAVCSRAVIISAGRLVADETPLALEARSPRHGAVRLALRGVDPESALARLSGLGEVERVERLDGEADRGSFLIYPRRGAALAHAVSLAVQQTGWEVAELHVERGRLDEVFRRVTDAGGVS